jgi:biotin carboxyl carrier protein
MKSYWITATVVLLTAWPLSSKAYGVDQSKAGQVQQTQPSNTSVTADDPVKAQEKPAAAATEAAANAPSASPQTKGSYLLVELTKTLKANKLKPGDKVKAEVAQDVVSHGKVIIPIETELVGHVTEVNVRDGENAESRLGIVFDRILLKHYHDINFQAVVQAIAPAVVKRSRVDQPSQMLPPSMVGGGPRSMTTAPAGNSTANRGQANPSASSNVSAGAIGTFQAPLTVKQSPTTHTESGTSAAQLSTGPGGKPLSIGMPQGVTGIKGLSLSATPSANTPGPVIVSNTDNVKLESGTQILLHVLSVESQK